MFLEKLTRAARKQELTAETCAKLVATMENKLNEVKSDTSKRVVTKYATYHVLAQIDEITAKNPDQGILLFIDEFNRCENAVMQELMNRARRFHITILG